METFVCKRCVVCEAPVHRGTRASKYCSRCFPHTGKLRHQIRRRAKSGKPPYTEEQQNELIRYYRAKEEGLKPPRPSFLYDTECKSTGIRRCLFCGNITNNQFYCKSCRGNGFHELHMATGKTNGWDKRRGIVSSKMKPHDSNTAGGFYTSHTNINKKGNYEVR
jgi:hypothetical protein